MRQAEADKATAGLPGGFDPPSSNVTWCPNQFFDVVLPHFPRGVVRLVGYLLWQTLAWNDDSGQPVETRHRLTWETLGTRARVSRGALGAALQDALRARLIQRVAAEPDDDVAKLFELRWADEGPYVRVPKGFPGFFSGRGHRTYVPNQLFTVVVAREPLAVVRVVGAIIRHSIGFEAEQGYRRTEAALSCRALARRTLVPVWLDRTWLERHGVRPRDLMSARTLREQLDGDLTMGLRTLLSCQDRNSMRFGVESRVPFLDPHLVELCRSIPAPWLFGSEGRPKALLRDAMRGLVPDVVALPQPETRLRLHDGERVSLLARRFAPAACLALPATLARVTHAPVRVLGDALGSLSSSAGRVVEGGVADLCLFDPQAEWSVGPGELCSQGKHTPFSFAGTGMALPGRVRATLVAGTVAHEAHAVDEARAA